MNSPIESNSKLPNSRQAMMYVLPLYTYLLSRLDTPILDIPIPSTQVFVVSFSSLLNQVEIFNLTENTLIEKLKWNNKICTIEKKSSWEFPSIQFAPFSLPKFSRVNSFSKIICLSFSPVSLMNRYIEVPMCCNVKS